ncbi:MAG TPA: 4-hydroxythreonine-4-phosphate dehydrogenase PdxA [Spirochaetales bacterium]|nr:4-hydroxythreonine-4-phosphate dehydrogenase PdxA [Spirochaetales bacterium]
MSGRPFLALTMGDAAGIGPEICAKTLARPGLWETCRPLMIGDRASMAAALESLPAAGRPSFVPVSPREMEGLGPGTPEFGGIPLYQPGSPLSGVVPGKLSAEAGRGAVEFVKAAVDLAKAGRVAGIVTAPLNKAAMHAAGFSYPGHTELLAEGFGVKNYSLVLSARGTFVFHATTHVSLRRALDLIDENRVYAQIRLAHLLARALGRGGETVAVAGLNPHAGEGGLFGTEEIDSILPAVERARAEGIPVEGPLPADVLFPRAARGIYRFLVAMYHDQGHGVFKTLYFDEGINVTVGLPVIRTSVDHGTAFDIAGKGMAKDESLAEAVRLAASLGPVWAEIREAARAALE